MSHLDDGRERWELSGGGEEAEAQEPYFLIILTNSSGCIFLLECSWMERQRPHGCVVHG